MIVLHDVLVGCVPAGWGSAAHHVVALLRLVVVGAVAQAVQVVERGGQRLGECLPDGGCASVVTPRGISRTFSSTS